MFQDRSRLEIGFAKIAGKLPVLAILAAGTIFFPACASAQQAGQKTFPSATEAAKALIAALQSNDQPGLLGILGADAKDLVSSGDEIEDKNDRDQFIERYERMHRLVNEPDGKTTLYIGAENWPTPIPIVQKSGVWYFDTPAGRREILYRRVGRNELAVIQLCHALVDAEKEYYALPHDGDTSKQYAQKFLSEPGKHDGLYWQSASGESESPIGPLVATAAAEGYPTEPNQKPQPFQGYYFRVLKGQGPSAPGSAHSYLVNGKMTRGFAFLAYPAEYRSSGVMTFIVNQDGIVYEKDLGRGTATIAKSITLYNQDATWRKSD